MAKREKVTKVIDGDTVWTDGRKRPVRLANVHAPELRQRGGKAAKAALERLVKGKTVSINTVAFDRWGRSVANMKVGNKSVNKAMRAKTK